MLKRLIFMVLSVLLLTVAVQAQALNGVTTTILNVRSGPAATYTRIGLLTDGVTVQVEARNEAGDWLLVNGAGMRGWVAGQYVSLNGDVASLPVSGEIIVPPQGNGSSYGGKTISALNVRSGPGTDFSTITTIASLRRVVIEARNNVGNWILIHSQDGSIRGWVATRYVNFDDGVSLNALPVSQEVIGGAPAPQQPAEQAAPAPAAAEGIMTGVTTATLNVRPGPSTSNNSIAQVAYNTRLAIEARNPSGQWLLVHTEDGSVRGWVAAAYVRAGDTGVLPVSEEFVGLDASGSTPSLELPDEDSQQLYDRLMNTPVLHNMVNGTVVALFERGRELGNNPHVFMLVGDSVTAGQPFLKGFGQGNYDLGPYAHLQPTIDWFMVPPRPGYNSSWTNEGFAARIGFTAAAVFDGLWVDPNVCSEGPIYCEYNYIKPSVAIVYFGGQDMQLTAPYTFQQNMLGIAQTLVDRGVIPVFTTFVFDPDLHYIDTLLYNNIVLDVAEVYDAPVINLWRAAQALPNGGAWEGDPVHLSQGPTFYSFNGEEGLYGVTLRNLLTLQALDELRRNVLSR
ncbi:MAG: hypothetical protein D6712_13655 [Chloroflexi bacterium]|nr:MAG: hypothetical protein D6712_13655 [Chloroflexota bacterium]